MIRMLKRYVQLAALGAVLVLIAGASPAAAAEGNGTGVGHFVFTPTGAAGLLCQSITGTYTGTYTGTLTNNSGTATYTGVLTATFVFSGYGNPAGTYQTPGCDTDPGGVDISTLTLEGYNDTSGGGNTVDCTFGAGGDDTFQRVGVNWVAKATGLGGGGGDGCNVSATGGTPAATTLTLTGVLDLNKPVGGCDPGPTLGNCPSVADAFVAGP